jgi:hypothetical protein
MFDVILGIGMVIIGFFATVALGCVILKVCFKIADKIFGL